MTVKQLKGALAGLPDNMEVFIPIENNEFAYSLVESAAPKEMTFSDGSLKAQDTVLVITDDFEV